MIALVADAAESRRQLGSRPHAGPRARRQRSEHRERAHFQRRLRAPKRPPQPDDARRPSTFRVQRRARRPRATARPRRSSPRAEARIIAQRYFAMRIADCTRQITFFALHTYFRSSHCFMQIANGKMLQTNFSNICDIGEILAALRQRVLKRAEARGRQARAINEFTRRAGPLDTERSLAVRCKSSPIGSALLLMSTHLAASQRRHTFRRCRRRVSTRDGGSF